ncbi:MAG: ABC transporter permease [Phycisphaerales bacterium]|nr:ABC transporter permease [Phycisphaerales bacterium]MCB9854380.1 ABC transporter permease [Phycisphaerales bacterium]MCB9863581.1 ABC transporter permease [Phycisphaerales bacterium]
MSRRFMRLRGFLRKELLQIRRDPSSILLALVMPVVLLILFGYGVSLDAENVPIAIVLDDNSSAARDLAARFDMSRYFQVTRARSIQEATRLVKDHLVDGIVRIDSSFSAELARGRVPIQILLNGVDSNKARLVQGYAQGVLASWSALRAARGESAMQPGVSVRQRVWFNEAVRSTDFLIPGLLTLIMTLIGVLLTALVIAREWERGTMEAVLATPLRTGEFLLGKIVPYYLLGMAGLALTVILGVYLFDVPFRGSFAALITLSSCFLLASLGLGLFISSATRVQFIAAQISLIVGFLPAFFLSGLLFDLESTPPFVQFISHAVPARHFVAISHTLFLAGDVMSILVPSGLILAGMATIFFILARSRLSLRLER